MGTAGLQSIGQINHLLDGFQISREQNDTARLVPFDERGQIVTDIYVCVADTKDGRMQNNVIDTIKAARQRLP
jgi:hypothetical protein